MEIDKADFSDEAQKKSADQGPACSSQAEVSKRPQVKAVLNCFS